MRTVASPRLIRAGDFIGKVSLAVVLKVSAAIFTFLTTALIARSADQALAGSLFVFISGLTASYSLGKFGLGNVILRRVAAASSTEDAKVFFGRALVMSTVASGLVATGTLLLFGDRILPVERSWLASLAFIFIVQLSSGNLISAFCLRGMGRNSISVFVQSVSLPGLVLLVIVVAFSFGFSIDLTVLAFSYIVGSVLTSLMVLYLIPMSRSVRGLFGDLPAWRSLFSEASPLVWVEAAQVATQWWPALLLSRYSGAGEVAEYFVSARLVTLLHIFGFAIAAVVSPKMARLYEQNAYTSLSILYRVSILSSVVAALIPILVLLFFPGSILDLFGASYDSDMTLRILVLGQVVGLCCGPCMNLLMMAGDSRSAKKAGLAGGLVAVVASVGLAPHYGALGVAIGTAGSVMAQNFFAVVLARRLIWPTLRE